MKLLHTFGASAAALVLGASVSFATTINFEADGVGNQANGFASADSAIATFTDTMGADLRLGNFGTQGDGNSLGVFGDDGSALQIDFSQNISTISLDFGNDDPGFVGVGGLAILEGYLNGAIVSAMDVLLNRDDVMNQTIGLSGIFDQVVFYYAESDRSRADLIEIVDNINFQVSAVPVPAAMPLLLLGLGGLGFAGRRRKTA